MRLPRSLPVISSQAVDEEQAIVVVSVKGRVQFATARARRWLKQYGLLPGSRVPKALAAWLEEAIASRWAKQCILKKEGPGLSFRVICREPDSISLLLEQAAPKLGKRDARDRLTERQADVLFWVARGKTNAQIAEILGLKTGTVGKYLERIFPKLGVENRTAAASFVAGSNDVP